MTSSDWTSRHGTARQLGVSFGRPITCSTYVSFIRVWTTAVRPEWRNWPKERQREKNARWLGGRKATRVRFIVGGRERREMYHPFTAARMIPRSPKAVSFNSYTRFLSRARWPRARPNVYLFLLPADKSNQEKPSASKWKKIQHLNFNITGNWCYWTIENGD